MQSAGGGGGGGGGGSLYVGCDIFSCDYALSSGAPPFLRCHSLVGAKNVGGGGLMCEGGAYLRDTTVHVQNTVFLVNGLIPQTHQK